MTFDENPPSRELQRALDAYRADVEPPRELLWKHVDARLHAHGGEEQPGGTPTPKVVRTPLRRIVAAASLLAAGGVFAVVLRLGSRSGEPVGRGTGGPAVGSASSRERPATPFEEPEAAIHKSLASAVAAVDERVRATEQALAEAPSDPYLKRHLAALQEARSALVRDDGHASTGT